MELLDDNGNWKHNLQDISGIAINYFKDIYTSCNPENLNQFTTGFCPSVSLHMNEMLVGEVIRNEVKEAAFSIHPHKASGDDGLTGWFFHKYWDIIGKDVYKALFEFFYNGKILKSVSHTIITLIPKVKQVQCMKDLRPIRLCNILYKVILKIMIRRLQPFTNSLIDLEQSIFTKGRLISDNILLCHEVMHYLKNCRKEKKYGIAVKLDINKAFDCVEW